MLYEYTTVERSCQLFRHAIRDSFAAPTGYVALLGAPLGAASAPKRAGSCDTMMADLGWCSTHEETVAVGVLSILARVWSEEGSVTEDKALNHAQGSTWRLLLQFVPPEESAGGPQSTERVTLAALELGMLPEEAERIGRAFKGALRQATLPQGQDYLDSPISIRVWVARLSRGREGHFSADTRGTGSRERRGWGCFLVQRKEEDTPPSDGTAHRLLELYIYQEGRRAEGRGRTESAAVPTAGDID